MRILFQLDRPAGIGADRWIVEGYRDAFEDLGHQTVLLTEQDDAQAVWRRVRPDMFVTSTNIVRHGEGFLDAIGAYRKEHHCTIFFHIGEDFAAHLPLLVQLRRKQLVDVWYSYYAPEAMAGFAEQAGVRLEWIPLAASARRHYPVASDPRFASDICFVGARLPTKEQLFRKMLLPLTKRYQVRIYGSGWTFGERALRSFSAAARAARFGSVAGWIDARRLALTPDEERSVYASAKICINIHEYFPDGRPKGLLNEREFKIPACGGFELTDRIVGIERYFVPGKEIAVVERADDWIPAVQYYLDRPEERRAIQERGTARVLREHTYHHRARRMLALCHPVS